VHIKNIIWKFRRLIKEKTAYLKMKAWRYRYIDFLHKVNLNADISM
jgi:hypothetical protein